MMNGESSTPSTPSAEFSPEEPLFNPQGVDDAGQPLQSEEQPIQPMAEAMMAAEASGPGPAITRETIIARAEAWLHPPVPYSQTTFKLVGERKYRTDCSGYVSMAWHTNLNYWTGTLATIGRPITYNELRPGDMLLYHNREDPHNGSHVVLFHRWVGAVGGDFYIYHQTGPHTKHQVWPQRYNRSKYKPFRYVNLTDAPEPKEVRQLDVVALGGGNQLYRKYYIKEKGKGWSDWGNLGAPSGGLTSDPAICSWEPRRWDIFVRAAGNQLVHKWFNGREWSDWEDLGGILTSGPAAVAWEPGRIDVVARGGGNQLYQKYYIKETGKGWSDWVNLGAPADGLTSDPAICSWEPRRLDIFARGANNQLVHKWFDTDKWFDWEDLGGILTSGPAAVSWEAGRIDVVALGGGNQLYQKYFRRGVDWSDWVNLGAPAGGLTSDPAICSWEPRRLDIFARGANNQLVHKWFNGSDWSGWEDLGGILTSGPDATSEPNRQASTAA